MHQWPGTRRRIVISLLLVGCLSWVVESSHGSCPQGSQAWSLQFLRNTTKVSRTMFELNAAWHEVLQTSEFDINGEARHLHQAATLSGLPPLFPQISSVPAVPPVPFPALERPPFVPNLPYSFGFPEIDVAGHPRMRVPSTPYPFNVVGLFENGCTGTLVGPCHVLTAGHCIFSHEGSGYNYNLGFSPGKNNGFQGRVIQWRDFQVSEKWLWQEDFNADYAIVSLQEPVGSGLGWMGFGYNLNEEIIGLNIAGYPIDKDLGSMWYDYCGNVRFDYDAVRTIHHGCEVAEGNSGSPMWVFARDTGFREIRAIHNGARVTRHGGIPYACIVTPAVTEDLKSMINKLQC